MSEAKVTVLGAGSLRCSPAVIGSLAAYAGERPLTVHLWDADEERLDLFDRFARGCFRTADSMHRLLATTDPDEALDQARAVIVTVGAQCAARYIPGAETIEERVRECLEDLAPRVPDGAEVLSLMQGWRSIPLARVDRFVWPDRFEDDEARAASLFHVLRCVNTEESFHPFIRDNAHSRVTIWLRERAAMIGC